MRDRPRPDRSARDVEELAVMLEAVVGQRLDDDVRRLDKARPRLAHRDAEPLVLDARRAAPKAEQAAPAAQNVQEGDLLGDPDRIVPRQHDDGGAEANAAGAPGEIRE